MSTTPEGAGRSPDDALSPEAFSEEAKELRCPARFAGLTGMDLEAALTSDNTEWTLAQYALASGRKRTTIDSWSSHQNRVLAWKRREPGAERAEPTHRTPPDPIKVYGRTKIFRAGDCRHRLMQQGILDTAGNLRVDISGNFAADRNPDIDYTRTSVVRDAGPGLLAEFNQLREIRFSQQDAYDALAAHHDLSLKQVKQRLEAGRGVIKPSSPTYLAEYRAAVDAGKTPEQALALVAKAHKVDLADARNRIRDGARAEGGAALAKTILPFDARAEWAVKWIAYAGLASSNAKARKTAKA